MSIKNLVTKTVARTVEKNAIVKPSDVSDLIKKAVGAPAETPLVPVNDESGALSHYTLAWTETPKARAPRKAKAEGETGTQA